MGRFLLPIVAVGLVVVVLVHQALLIPTRAFDPDELQHLHSAWCVSEGMVPYADFFEHHTPGLSYLLAPVLHLLDVESSVDRAFDAIFLARGVMWLLTIVTLALTFALAELVWDRRVAWASVVLLATTLMFQAKALEIRPDLISVPCLLTSLLLVVLAVRAPERWPIGKLVGAGLLTGIAVLFTQKALFALPGVAGAVLWIAADRRLGGKPATAAQATMSFGAGFVAPLVAAMAWFASRGALGPFVELNLFYNLNWDSRFSPLVTVGSLVRQNPLTVAFGIAGWLAATAGVIRVESIRRGELVIVLGALTLGIGAFVIPAPWPQYFLMGLPLLAILAGRFVVSTVARLARRRPTFVDPALATVLVAVSLPFAWSMAFEPSRSAQGQLQGIRYVMEHTRTDQTVLDGTTGCGVFRPHAFFYGFLNWELRAMLSAEEKERLLTDLRTGRIVPQAIGLDDDLAYLSDELTDYVEKNYLPVGVGQIWMRRVVRTSTDEVPPS